MDTETIVNFFKELSKCQYFAHEEYESIEKFKYNGITLAEGTESYYYKLQEMFINFKMAIIEMSDEREKVIALYEQFSYLKKVYLDIPNEQIIKRMEHDYRTSRNASLAKSIKRAKFLREMNIVQQSFITETILFILNIVEVNKPIKETNKQLPQPISPTIRTVICQPLPLQNPNSPRKYPNTLHGIRDFALYMGIGMTKASKIVKSEILPRDAQYNVGNVWIFNIQKLEQLKKEHPELLVS